MTAIARGATSSATTPLLDIWTTDGQLVDDPDPGTLTFTIVDLSTEEKEATPVVVIGPVTVDLTDDRIGSSTTPHFAASFTLDASEPTGAHEIRWVWELGGVPFTWAMRFDVLKGIPRGLGTGWGLVSDLRAEGFAASDVSDVRLLKLLAEQRAFVERVTGQFFEPRHLSMKIDGTDSRDLLLGHPIIALDLVQVGDTLLDIDPSSAALAIYNRHLREGLLDPDDRWVPRIAIPGLPTLAFDDAQATVYQNANLAYLPGRFPANPQIVTVSGLFGYTDPDGSPFGKTPDAARRALYLLVQRHLPKLACTDEVFDARMAGRVSSLRTRDQSITYAVTSQGEGGMTGDLEIDRLLYPFMRLRMGVP